jgi:uncharacterized membrane protein
VSRTDWLLFLHITGAFLLVGGSVAAATFTILARRRERPSQIAEFLRLVRVALPLIYGGVLLTLVFGLWLVHDSGYSYSDAWIIAALVLWVAGNALGGIGGSREEKTRELAEQLAAADDVATPELGARLRDPVSLALNFGSGLAVLAVLALMIWKPS